MFVHGFIPELPILQMNIKQKADKSRDYPKL